MILKVVFLAFSEIMIFYVDIWRVLRKTLSINDRKGLFSFNKTISSYLGYSYNTEYIQDKLQMQEVLFLSLGHAKLLLLLTMLAACLESYNYEITPPYIDTTIDLCAREKYPVFTNNSVEN